jgi:hypothetical protein
MWYGLTPRLSYQASPARADDPHPSSNSSSPCEPMCEDEVTATGFILFFQGSKGATLFPLGRFLRRRSAPLFYDEAQRWGLR